MEHKLLAFGITIGDNPKEYTLDFNLESVKGLAKYSLTHDGKLSDETFIKFALNRYHEKDMITDKKVKEIQETLATLDDSDDNEMSYSDVIEHLIKLYMQAIDDAASMVEPATVSIEKDNSVTVGYNGEKYKLTFTRADIKDAVLNNSDALSYNSPIELFSVSTALIKLAMQHYNKRFSVKLQDELFLALWATKFDESTKDDFPEVIDALRYHMVEVANSASKNSKGAVKIRLIDNNAPQKAK